LGVAGHHEIWELCGEAAVADSGDPLYIDPVTGTGAGVYDVDLNCKIDLVDFAAFAAAWLDKSVLYQ
jgi:hypothetical protein